MLELFWELHQQSRLAEAQGTARNAARAADQVARDIVDMRERIEKLTLICAAIWTLLQRHAKLSDEQLTAMVEQLDLTDGRLDGRVRKDTRPCLSCSRPVAPRHVRCIYCGAEMRSGEAFDLVL